nr:MAG TPA: hypothetical protein [Caudoviricetes sp.]
MRNTSGTKTMTTKDRSILYDDFQFVGSFCIPLIVLAAWVLTKVVDFPFWFDIIGVFSIINVLVGTFLAVKKRPYDGDLNIIENGDKQLFDLKLETTPEEITEKDSVSFKVCVTR